MTNSSTYQLVLIINQDSQTNYLLERVIKSMGLLVEISTSFVQAKQYFSPITPAIIIVQESLVVKDDFEWIKQIRNEFPSLPILLFADQQTDRKFREIVRQGVNDILTPPLTRDDILQSIQLALSETKRYKEWVVKEASKTTQQLQSRVNDLETLTRLGRSVNSSLNLDEVLKTIVDSAVEVTGAEEGSLLLLDEDSGELYMRASKNFNDEFVNTFRLPIQDSLAGNVLRTGNPVILDENTPQKIKTSYLVQSLIYVPLALKGHVLGILGVDNRHRRFTFKSKDLALLTTMAEYAVVAIENARLYEAMQTEHKKLDTIINRIEDGVMVLDQDNRVLLINRSAQRALELAEKPNQGTSVKALMLDPELQAMIFRGEVSISNRTELVTHDEHIYSAQLTPIPNVGMAVTLHDITYLKKLDRIKSDFVNTVSHDLRSPLTAILGYVDLIERAGEVNETQKEFINRVQGSVQSITTLVNDLLNLGRIETGFDTRKELVDLNIVIDQAIDDMYQELTTRDQKIEVEKPDHIPQIFASPVQIRQMLDNLLNNACKYSPNESTIQVMIHVESKQLIIQVKDEGYGIPAVDLPFIFDKFYRSGNVSSEVPGTGLGLAIVKTIVDNHEGRIWVDSNLGKGTTFTVVLPVSD